MGRIMSVTLSHFWGVGGGCRIRICFAQLGWGMSEVFLGSVNVIRPFKRERVHKNLLTDHQRGSLKSLILITFHLVPLQSPR